MKAASLKIFFGFLILIMLPVGILRGDPLAQWAWRYPVPQGYTLAAVTYGGGLFVAVGDSGTIISSTDGYDWKVQCYGAFPHLCGVAYADGAYAAVGDGGVILVSTNATNWTQIASPTTSTLRGVAGDSAWRTDGMPQFLAVGDSGSAVVCSNTTNWSVISSGTSNSLYAVTKPSTANFIGAGDGGTILRLVTRTRFVAIPTNNVGTTGNFYGVAVSTNGIAAAVGDLNMNLFAQNYGGTSTNEILYSTNLGGIWSGQQWVVDQNYENPNLWDYSDSFRLYCTASGPKGFVAGGDSGYTSEYDHPAVIFSSANGTNWAELSSQTSENNMYGCAYGNGLYVMVGGAGGILVSSNLVNFTEVTGFHRSAIFSIACNSNLCIASALPMQGLSFTYPNFTTLVSSGGINWSVSTTNLPAMVDLAANQSLFVAVPGRNLGYYPSGGNSLYATTDGYNWNVTATCPNTLHGVKFLNNRFIAVGDNGSIFSSSDGLSWNTNSIATTNSFSGVAFGNGTYVAAGYGAATSSDGVSWSVCPANPPAAIGRIIYASGLFVAIGSTGSSYGGKGQILSSPDGTNWQVRFTSLNNFPFSGLAYNGGLFLVSSGFGAMCTSRDGINWTNLAYTLPLVDAGEYGYYYGFYNSGYSTVCAYNQTFLAAGWDGVLVQSGGVWNPASLSSPRMTPGGFAFSYNQQMDVPYHVQSSSNLSTWSNVFSGTGTGLATNFLDATSTNHFPRFYRIVSP